MKITASFASFFTALKRAGYRRGLTYQSIPFDFRKSYRVNNFNNIFEANLKRMNRLSGKKIAVITHSMGALNVQYALSRMSQNEKDQLVAFWLAQAPPFLGALKCTRIVVSGFQDLYFKFFGFHFDSSVKVTTNHAGYYELLYRNPFAIYKNHEWFDWVIDR